MRFTTKGRITLLRDGVQISTHVLAEEAYERAYAHALANGPGKYTVRYPDREVDLSTLTRVVLEAAPAGLTTQAISSSQVNLTWTANPRAASYRVYRNSVLVGSPTTASYSDTGLSPSTAYTYTVSTVSATTGEGPQSAAVQGTTLAAPDTTAPTAPVITATPTGQNTISVALTTPATDTQSGVASYDLEYKTAAASTYTAITPVTAGQFPYIIGSLSPATTYNTRARARDGVGNIGPYSSVSNATTQAAAGGAVTPSLVVEYVDTSGVYQTTTIVDGVTSISAVAPFFMHLDASGSRSVQANANTEVGAWHNLGYRINYGEALGTFWPYPQGTANSMDEDTGQPIFGRVFTTTGTKTVRLKVRDSANNEATISFNVVLSAPPAPTIIETSAGGWPTWVSGTHYALRAGANYSSFGAIDLRQRHNIIISKTGSGADPIVGTVYFDGRIVINDIEANYNLGRGHRLVDIDVAEFGERGVGQLFNAFVRGRVRTHNPGASGQFAFENDATNANERNSVRRVRGLMFWNQAGEMLRGPTHHVIIGGGNRWHFYGFSARLDAGTPNLSVSVLRLYLNESSMRYCRTYNTYHDSGMQTWLVLIGLGDIATYPGYSPVAYTDRWGDGATDTLFLPIVAKVAVQKVQLGVAGNPWPNGPGTIGGPVNESWVADRLSWEDCVSPYTTPTAYPITANITGGGRNLAKRNVKYNNGAGAEFAWTFSTPDPAFNGPYVNETTNTRPVPSSF